MGKRTLTPREYLAVLKEQRAVIKKAQAVIDKAYDAAQKARPPKARRPAKPKDIVEGAIIWHANGDDGWFWNIVEEVLRPSDAFKAYCADDGCRYGLDGAWVEEEI